MGTCYLKNMPNSCTNPRCFYLCVTLFFVTLLFVTLHGKCNYWCYARFFRFDSSVEAQQSHCSTEARFNTRRQADFWSYSLISDKVHTLWQIDSTREFHLQVKFMYNFVSIIYLMRQILFIAPSLKKQNMWWATIFNKRKSFNNCKLSLCSFVK